MHHPPKPHYGFTIPSIHDDTTLACRIYHPEVLSEPKLYGSNGVTQWRPRGIVIAHPYAPMGGSYDDRVVCIVVAELLALGYVVGTFNFRGAHGSKGRTSWSGRPEVDDYISFAAFFMLYVSHIRAFPSSDAISTPEQSPVSPQAQQQAGLALPKSTGCPVIILGGYSYGSVILRHLPPVPSILQPFSSPLDGSAASEIVLRAQTLSNQSNLEWLNLARDHEQRKRKGYDNRLSVTVGGEETSPEQRKTGREIRRSIDGRHSLDLGSRIRGISHRKEKGNDHPIAQTDGPSTALAISVPDIRYLLISPLTPPISTLATPGLVHRPWSKGPSHQEVIGKHISLAIYGDQDIFTSYKKTQQWAGKLSSEAGSRFSHVEIAGAGHFWNEDGVEEKMRIALKEWEAHVRD